MSYIKKIQKALSANKNVSNYLITENISNTYELFFDIHKLETMRTTETVEDTVTVYKDFTENGVRYLGSSSFTVSHTLNSKELDKLINDALYAASFVKNKYYDLAHGDKKKSVKNKLISSSPFDELKSIALEFINSNDEYVKFNSLELFYYVDTTHTVNSCGVDYSKQTLRIEIEDIPSYKNGDNKTEVYRTLYYDSIDLDRIRQEVKTAILDCYDRANAIKFNGKNKLNVILRDSDVKELFSNISSDYNYYDVYQGTALKKIGDALQVNPTCPLTLTVGSSGKADFFDSDGTLIKNTVVFDKGIVSSYYGSQRYAYYLGVEASGTPSKITVNKGKKSIDSLMKKPYLEILALSNIQIDTLSGFIGGEIRLAKYFDGKNITPVSGLSFSGNLNKAISEFELSKETIDIMGYSGPRYVLLKDMDVM